MLHIIDDNGIIHSGTESDMVEAFDAMTMNEKDFARNYNYAIGLARSTKKEYDYKWSGDLILINAIRTHR